MERNDGHRENFNSRLSSVHSYKEFVAVNTGGLSIDFTLDCKTNSCNLDNVCVRRKILIGSCIAAAITLHCSEEFDCIEPLPFSAKTIQIRAQLQGI